MNVLLLNQYYAPDRAATAQLAADLGADLASAGHRVTAIASDRDYADAGGARLPRRDRIDGVDVRRVRSSALGRDNRLARMVDYASFYAGAALELARGERPDVVVALTTPPFISTLPATLRARSRLVVWSMDVYPDVAIALGALPPRGVVSATLRRVNAAVLHRADAVVALDDAMRDRLVSAGARSERTVVIDNWWDGRDVYPIPTQESTLRRSLGLGDRFVVAYFGNLGLGHDFQTLLGAMKRLPDPDRFAWLFVGHGPQREHVARAVGELGVEHRFVDPVPRAGLGDALAAADAHYVSLHDGLEGLVVPSKLYSALAAGRPLVYVGPSRGRCAELVHAGAIGVQARNGDVAALAAELERLRTSPTACAEMGRRGRALFDARFDRARGFAAHRTLLEGLVQRC